MGDKPGTGGKRFLFVGHYDTVFPSGTAKQRPFRIDDQGRAWGPGVYDMQGGLAAVLYAMRAQREARTRMWEETNVAVVFNAELGSRTAAAETMPSPGRLTPFTPRRSRRVGVTEGRPSGRRGLAGRPHP